jgi:hypothetical protein
MTMNKKVTSMAVREAVREAVAARAKAVATRAEAAKAKKFMEEAALEWEWSQAAATVAETSAKAAL